VSTVQYSVQGPSLLIIELLIGWSFTKQALPDRSHRPHHRPLVTPLPGSNCCCTRLHCPLVSPLNLTACHSCLHPLLSGPLPLTYRVSFVCSRCFLPLPSLSFTYISWLFRCLPPPNAQLSSWLIVKSLRQPQRPPLFVAVDAHLLPPDALLSSWVIVKSLHRLRCPPLFVAVAARPPPPAALLSRRRCLSLNRRSAAPFIVVPLVLLSSLRHRCHPWGNECSR
jgi:hypothetical protein